MAVLAHGKAWRGMGQTASPPQDNFDRGKPFHPLVSIYTIAIHGLKELAFRGILDIEHEVTGSPTVDQVLGSITTGNEELDDGLRKLREPLSLLVACDGSRITGTIGLTAREVAENHDTILPALLPALGSILTLAYEIIKEQLTEGQRLEPVPQFLRHVRNAVAHNGRFDIRSPLSRPAVWCSFVLHESMDGDRLFKDAAGDGLFGPGDPIRLLWDIEQAYPNLTA